jgi:hypothetical protein
VRTHQHNNKQTNKQQQQQQEEASKQASILSRSGARLSQFGTSGAPASANETYTDMSATLPCSDVATLAD